MFSCEVNKGNEYRDGVPDHVKELDKHSRNNSTKSPAPDTCNVSEPRLMS
jgi:hypothetical protein